MERKGKSVVIYLPSLASGGAERLHIGISPSFIEAGWDVTFLLQHAEGAFLPVVPKEARVVALNTRRTLSSLPPLVRYLREEQPDILLSNLGHNNIVAIWATLLARVRTRIITIQHSTLSLECQQHTTWQYRVLPLLYRLFLRWAHGIVCVSQGVADDLAARSRTDIRRITVIYNPVIFRDFEACMQAQVTHPWFKQKKTPVILAAGRMHEQKDFTTLISAFAHVVSKREVKLILLGEGPLQAQHAAHAKALGIEDRIDMVGFVLNPLPYMRAADLLVMSSIYEGFGNVLAEALACGTGVVSTDCPHGPSEILERGKYGRLAPVGNSKALADAILDALDHPLPKEMLQKRGREFTVERGAALYLQLFNKLISA